MATLTFEVKQHLTGHIRPLVIMQIQAWFKQHKLCDQLCPPPQKKTTQLWNTAHCNYTDEGNIQQCMHNGKTFTFRKTTQLKTCTKYDFQVSPIWF